ncbi:glycosyltransferase family 1 protein [Heliocybe sulcata]|uniref:UDP-N-acetylglucosamine transferase subunit ALG14 n=1 Tax=Heliocybe sulcata TaxID=5364 RepID=A0A5C3NBS5_9AGAM|nr:glycosyltransferase family 1 protein [Heliocybe sulcata]
MEYPTFLLLSLAVTLLLVRRTYSLTLPRPEAKRRSPSEPCSFAVFLGSGGHTSEALALVAALDFSRYYPRTYIISEGDSLSAQKARDLEASKSKIAEFPDVRTDAYRLLETTGDVSQASAAAQYTLLTIPRARRVHQSLLATPPAALYSLASCIYHVTILPLMRTGRSTPLAEVLLLNGPGTCLTLCMAAYINRFFGLPSPRLIYVESFARVQSLSLSGKLLRPLVDRFLVQWPELRKLCPQAEYRGWLV